MSSKRQATTDERGSSRGKTLRILLSLLLRLLLFDNLLLLLNLYSTELAHTEQL